VMRSLQTRGELRRDDRKRNILGCWRGVGPHPHPVRLCCVGSGLPKMPNRPKFGREDGTIWRMPAYLMRGSNESGRSQRRGPS
jgi:hypothetical protein